MDTAMAVMNIVDEGLNAVEIVLVSLDIQSAFDADWWPYSKTYKTADARKFCFT